MYIIINQKGEIVGRAKTYDQAKAIKTDLDLYDIKHGLIDQYTITKA